MPTIALNPNTTKSSSKDIRRIESAQNNREALSSLRLATCALLIVQHGRLGDVVRDELTPLHQQSVPF